MVTWAEKVAFVGMTMETVPSPFLYGVRVCIPDGLGSYGDGNTMEEAIESAAWGMNMGWWPVERKITEQEWQRMSHL